MKEANLTLSQYSSSLSNPKVAEKAKEIDIQDKDSNPSRESQESNLDSSRTITELDSSLNDDLDNSLSIRKTSTEYKNNQHGRWTTEEHCLFLEGLVLYGNEWKQVQNHITTRSATQARSHAQKFFIRIRKSLNSENDLGNIKQFIFHLFTNILGDKFKPKNMNTFLDMMVKLVFSEVSVQKLKIPSLKYKMALKSKKLKKINTKKTKSNSEKKTKKLKKDYNNSTLPSKKSNKLSKKSVIKNNNTKETNFEAKTKIFSILKDQSKRTRTQDNSKTKNDMNLNFQNLSKNFQIQPPYINILTINMVNNTNNNYVNTPSQNQEREVNSKQNNPFNLEFEQLLPKTKNTLSSFEGNFFNTGLNNQDDIDVFSLFDYHN